MRCKILHESKERMRVHLYRSHMTPFEADRLEYYLDSFDCVKKVSVNERTSNAIIFFDRSRRDDVLSLLANFDMVNTKVIVPEHTGRELRIKYEDEMFFHIARKVLNQLFIPASVGKLIIILKAVPYILSGLKALLRGKLEVSVLDATSIGVSLLRGDHDTAGSVIFLLKIGELMEEWTHRKSVDDLARAMSLNIDKVWVMADDSQEILVNISDVKVGDNIIVRTGSMIPLDGIVLHGDASVNQAAMTGESAPVHKTTDSLNTREPYLKRANLSYPCKKLRA